MAAISNRGFDFKYIAQLLWYFYGFYLPMEGVIHLWEIPTSQSEVM